jgi:hypothetical protein
MGAAQNIFNGFLRVTLAEKNPGLGRLQAEQKKLLIFKVLEQIAGVRSKAAPLTFLRIVKPIRQEINPVRSPLTLFG